jgi:hypothetical protein
VDKKEINRREGGGKTEVKRKGWKRKGALKIVVIYE